MLLIISGENFITARSISAKLASGGKLALISSMYRSNACRALASQFAWSIRHSIALPSLLLSPYAMLHPAVSAIRNEARKRVRDALCFVAFVNMQWQIWCLNRISIGEALARLGRTIQPIIVIAPSEEEF